MTPTYLHLWAMGHVLPPNDPAPQPAPKAQRRRGKDKKPRKRRAA